MNRYPPQHELNDNGKSVSVGVVVLVGVVVGVGQISEPVSAERQSCGESYSVTAEYVKVVDATPNPIVAQIFKPEEVCT